MGLLYKVILLLLLSNILALTSGNCYTNIQNSSGNISNTAVGALTLEDQETVSTWSCKDENPCATLLSLWERATCFIQKHKMVWSFLLSHCFLSIIINTSRLFFCNTVVLFLWLWEYFYGCWSSFISLLQQACGWERENQKEEGTVLKLQFPVHKSSYCRLKHCTPTCLRLSPSKVTLSPTSVSHGFRYYFDITEKFSSVLKGPNVIMNWTDLTWRDLRCFLGDAEDYGCHSYSSSHNHLYHVADSAIRLF